MNKELHASDMTNAEKRLRQFVRQFVPQVEGGSCPIWGVVTKIRLSENGHSIRHIAVLAIDNDNGVPRLVDVSIYVGLFLGLRRDKLGNVIIKGDLADIARDLSRRLGYNISSTQM